MSKKATFFIKITMRGTESQNIIVASSFATVLQDLKNVATRISNAKQHNELAKITHCEHTDQFVNLLATKSKHLFNETIYINPDDVISLEISADDIPVISEKESDERSQKFLDKLKKGELEL